MISSFSLKLALLGLLVMGSSLNAQSKLETILKNFEQDPALQYGVLGFCLVDVDKNQTLLQRHAQMSLIPASSLKAVTTGTALAILGKDYRFETHLEYDGVLDPATGTLKGNLYIRGGGDPSLGSPWMPNTPGLDSIMGIFATRIQAAGIRQIEGSIIGDASYFDDMGIIESWQWGDLGNYYGAGAYGLNIADNFYTLTFKQNPRVGGDVGLQSTNPNMSRFGIHFRNNLKAGPTNSGDESLVFAAPYDTLVEIRGTVPAGTRVYSVYGAIPNPPLFAAQYLTYTLNNRGLKVKEGADYQNQAVKARKAQNTRKLIYTHKSPALLDIAKHTNEESRNHYCEALLKAMALQQRGNPNTEIGTEVVKEFWEQRGIDTKGWFLKDGSGLSARNGISPKILTQILRKMYVDDKAFCKFDQCLPVCGQSGTMKNVAKGTAAQGNVRAKSGSIGRVRTYCGYVRGKSGKEYCFAIMVNNYTGPFYGIKHHFEKLMAAMTELD